MIPWRHLRAPFREAGALSEHLNLWGYISETVFLTKSGAVGCLLRVDGVDDECMDHAQREQITQTFVSALRLFDDRFRLYQYVVRVPVAPIAPGPASHAVVSEALQRRHTFLSTPPKALYVTTLWYAVIYEPPVRQSPLGQWQWWERTAASLTSFSWRRTREQLRTGLDQAVKTLEQRLSGFTLLLADTVRPTLLSASEGVPYLRALVNDSADSDGARRLVHGYLDYAITDTCVECHRNHLSVGRSYVRVLTLKTPPTQTMAHTLRVLENIPGPWRCVTEWQALPAARVRHEIKTRQRHWHQTRTSLVNYLEDEQPQPSEMLVDDSAQATVQSLGACLTALEVEGRTFGKFTLTIVMSDRDPIALDNRVSMCVKAFAGLDAVLFEETYNRLGAWLATVPGGHAHNVRGLMLMDQHCADLAALFTPDLGEPISPHLRREYLAIFEGTTQTPYYANLHVHDVGHTLVLGSTGAGKSFLLNFLVTHAQKYDPFTLILDLGGSYRTLMQILDGRYLRIGLTHRDVHVNPFSLPPTADNLHFLAGFVRTLVQSGGQYRTSMQDDRELHAAVEHLYLVDSDQRRLSTLANLLPRPLAQYLHRWIQGGPYADLFDHVEDTLAFDRLQCLDFEGLDQYPLVLEPLLFYVLHRATMAISDPAQATRLKVCVLDEAWRFAADDTFRAYLREALKTWRKKHASMIMATHNADDFATAGLLQTVIESCPTVMLLANPGLDAERYQRLFHLSSTELQAVMHLIPRRQFLLKRPTRAKVLNLHVDPRSYYLYTVSPLETERVRALVQAHGLDAALDRLTQSPAEALHVASPLHAHSSHAGAGAGAGADRSNRASSE